MTDRTIKNQVRIESNKGGDDLANDRVTNSKQKVHNTTEPCNSKPVLVKNLNTKSATNKVDDCVKDDNNTHSDSESPSDYNVDCHMDCPIDSPTDSPIDNSVNNTPSEVTSDEISSFLSKIQNKYSGNAEQKHLNQMYDIGILITNKTFNHQKLVQKLTKIIEDRSRDPIKKVREHKRRTLIDALKKGVEDGMSEEYRMAYDNCSKYKYDSEKLKKRAHIDSVLDSFDC
ncbi:hypothetical protein YASMINEVIRUS_774 [Yasminevirus sp. GU-2018]|uniref:Uncharacterized protein n=1 Tax=Yasminevirus sp. GU-2018 TaxID=2420051 RepID=A0A5K0U9Q2_9VIRU|nr:hypothetical protein YASMINEVIRUS_774 [Yasminevirus sp. GU-2018]